MGISMIDSPNSSRSFKVWPERTVDGEDSLVDFAVCEKIPSFLLSSWEIPSEASCEITSDTFDMSKKGKAEVVLFWDVMCCAFYNSNFIGIHSSKVI